MHRNLDVELTCSICVTKLSRYIDTTENELRIKSSYLTTLRKLELSTVGHVKKLFEWLLGCKAQLPSLLNTHFPDKKAIKYLYCSINSFIIEYLSSFTKN